MCQWIMLGLVFLGLVGAAAIFAIVKFVPPPWCWIVLAALPVVGMIVIAKAGSSLLAIGGYALFNIKSAALRGARAKVNSVVLTTRPRKTKNEDADDEDDDSLLTEDEKRDAARAKEEEAQRIFYLVDVTITPKPGMSPMRGWDPTELVIISASVPEVRFWNFQKVMDQDDDQCSIRRFEYFRDGQFSEEDFATPMGERRLQLLVAVKRGAESRQKLRYYFEDLAEFTLT